MILVFCTGFLIHATDAEDEANKQSLALWLKDVGAIKAARMTIAQSEDVEAIQKIDERVTAVQDAIKGKNTLAATSKTLNS